MSIMSMTGFGKGVAQDHKFDLSIEIKAVNHRFKDYRFRMAPIFNAIELDLKKKLEKSFRRGSFDIFIFYKKSEDQLSFDDIDEFKVEDLIHKIQLVANRSKLGLNVRPTDFLRNEFYKQDEGKKEKALHLLALQAMDDAITALIKSRSSEGIKLKNCIIKHVEDFSKKFDIILDKKETFKDEVVEKLKRRFADFSSELKIDEPRFLQEVVYYLEKLDIDEEINRLKSHISKLSGLFEEKNEVGRQIDFIVQEMNRETNTIGSKSSSQLISDVVIQMKVQLEKIREQGLNIE